MVSCFYTNGLLHSVAFSGKIKMVHPCALIILDGWGCREDKRDNAIALAQTPCWDSLMAYCTHRQISGSGTCVGLPAGQMGNSEVGHLHMGAGRTLRQDLTRIDQAIQEGSFSDNPVLLQALDRAVQCSKAVHVMGLLSDGGVHSHNSHFHALIRLAAARGVTALWLHAFLDGRDTAPTSAAAFLSATEAVCRETGCGKMASLIGRFYAMDRDKHWDRIEKAFRLTVMGEGLYTAEDALAGLSAAAARGETDEFVAPVHLAGAPPIQPEDSVIFMNFRADRARQLTAALTDPAFDGFVRPVFPAVQCITLTEYDPAHPLPTAFPSDSLQNMLGEYIARLGYPQLRLAETEKYAHVTFFFNGGREKPFPGEDRILIPSPRVTTYDLAPDMSAEKLTDTLIDAIQEKKQKKYALIICNFANADMVGHTGNLTATVQAIETLDHCLSRIMPVLQASGWDALITADHGNAEIMTNSQTGEPHTAHTSEPVPLVHVGRAARLSEKQEGTLADIAPTLLHLMGLPQPPDMTGQSLLILEPAQQNEGKDFG